MRIVVLDGYTLNPGDLSWDALRRSGDLTVHERSSADEVIPRAREAEALLVNKIVLERRTLEELPKLRYIGVTATGYNIVDVKAARERDIAVTNVPTYGTSSVAQMVFAHLLEHTQHVAHHARTVREGRWSRSQDFCYWDYPLIELEGLTLGIIGYGRIGQAVARLGLAFGMKVVVHDPAVSEGLDPGIEAMELDEVFRRADVLSLHCPLTAETEGLVNQERLALMKPTAFLINTSRGPLIDEVALEAALSEGRLAGAGLDVLAIEPPPPDHLLYQVPECQITPHIAWATRSARSRLMDQVVRNLEAFLEGKAENRV